MAKALIGEESFRAATQGGPSPRASLISAEEPVKRPAPKKRGKKKKGKRPPPAEAMYG